MSTGLRDLLLTLVAVVVLGGCSRSARPPKSDFFSTVDLNVIAKTAGGEDVDWGSNGFGSSGTNRFFEGDFRCKPESLARFLKALKVGLQEAVKERGGQVSPLRGLAKESGVAGFGFDYSFSVYLEETGHWELRGMVQMVVGPQKEGQHEDYQYPHKVTIQIDEPFDAQNRPTVPKSP